MSKPLRLKIAYFIINITKCGLIALGLILVSYVTFKEPLMLIPLGITAAFVWAMWEVY